MTQAVQKMLTLATESLDMLRAVMRVSKDSLDKADAWVERLGIVGVRRPQSSQLHLPLPHTCRGIRYPRPLAFHFDLCQYLVSSRAGISGIVLHGGVHKDRRYEGY